jgi:hypothetical protein
VRPDIPWELILSLLVPLLLWQSAQGWKSITWRVRRMELALWVFATLCLGGLLFLLGRLSWSSALFLGVISMSILSRSVKEGHDFHLLSQFGPLALVFLLTEVVFVLERPRQYFGSFFSGAFVGVLFTLISIYWIKQRSRKHLGWAAIGQSYFVYWIASVMEVSAISATLVNIVVFVEFFDHKEKREVALEIPGPLDQGPVFFAALALFSFLGWQIHQPVTVLPMILLTIGLGLGLYLALARTQDQPILQGAWKTGLFLVAALFLLPMNLAIAPVLLLVAFGSALFLLLIAPVLIATLHFLRERSDGSTSLDSGE